MADKPTQPFHYRYPLTKLDKSDDYLKITILQYKPPGIIPTGSFALPTSDDANYPQDSGAAGDNIEIKGTIILPIPDDIKDGNSAQWGPSEINLVSSLALGATGALVGQGVDNFTNKIKGGIEELLKASTSGTTQKAIQSYGISKAVNLLLSGQDKTADVAGRVAGVAANSNIELIFSGVKLREGFTFGFDIVPRSQKEAQEVREIIRALKRHSAAKKSIGAATGLFLKAPEVFRIEYMSGGKPHPYLNRFKICALQSMSVNYAASGTYATYSDGAPVNMTIGLGFQELTPIFAEDYDKVDGMGY